MNRVQREIVAALRRSHGAALAEARKRCLLSQREVAEYCGVSRQYLGQIETGACVASAAVERRMAALYGLTYVELVSLGMEAR